MLSRKAVRSLTATFGAVALAASGGTGLGAQEVEGTAPNPLLELTFGQSFEISNNPDLDVEAEGVSAISQTDLGVVFASATRVSELTFALGGGFEAGNFGDGQGFDTRLAERTALLSYARASRNSALELDVDYRRARLADIVLTDEFEGEDLILSGGARERLSFGAALALGIEAPMGLNLAVEHSETDYIDVPATEATPRSDTSLSARLRLAVARNAEVALLASAERSEYDDETEYVSESYALGVGAAYEVSPVLSLSAELGGSRVETSEDTLGGGRETDRIRGLTGSISADLDRPNGTLALDVSTALSSTGRRTRLQFSRAYDLPRGNLAFSAGTTDSDSTDPSLLVFLAYGRELPRGQFQATLSQEAVSAEGEEALRSRLALSLQREINAVSGWNAAFSLANYAVLSGTGADTRRAEATLAWRRALTRDWDLQAGYRHVFADSSAEPSRSSNTIFVGLESSISLLP